MFDSRGGRNAAPIELVCCGSSLSIRFKVASNFLSLMYLLVILGLFKLFLHRIVL